MGHIIRMLSARCASGGRQIPNTSLTLGGVPITIGSFAITIGGT